MQLRTRSKTKSNSKLEVSSIVRVSYIFVSRKYNKGFKIYSSIEVLKVVLLRETF